MCFRARRPCLIGHQDDEKHLIKIIVLLAGLPRAQSARGTEPHTHGIWSTSFRLVVTWLTERKYVRTHASTDCTGGVGETIKRKGGVSQACLGKSTSFIYDIHNMVNWQLSKQYSHSWTWTYRGHMCHLIEVKWFIWNLSADQLNVLVDREQRSISYFLASLGTQENR